MPVAGHRSRFRAYDRRPGGTQELPDAGRIEALTGENAEREGPLAVHAAFVPPRPALFAGTILDNLSLFDERLRPRARALADELGLTQITDRLPRGLLTEVGYETLPVVVGRGAAALVSDGFAAAALVAAISAVYVTAGGQTSVIMTDLFQGLMLLVTGLLLLWLGIDYLIPIGGDDTLSYAAHLNKAGYPQLAIPKTMDNDVYGTDYCIGFGTAITRSVQMISDLRTPIGSHERIGVVEVFGRYAG